MIFCRTCGGPVHPLYGSVCEDCSALSWWRWMGPADRPQVDDDELPLIELDAEGEPITDEITEAADDTP